MPSLAAISPEGPFVLHSSAPLSEAVTAMVWSLGAEAVVGCADGRLYRFDANGAQADDWAGHEGGVTRLVRKPGDGNFIASAGEDGRVRLWDLSTGCLGETLLDESDWIEHLDWTPDGQVLAAAARKTISLWRGCESLGMWYDARRRVLAMAWAPDGKRLATASNKGLFLWRMGDSVSGNAEPVQLLTFPGAPVSVAWHARGAALAVGTQDGFLQVWRPAVAGGKARQLTMRGYTAKVACLAWHPSKSLIATAGGPDVVLWDIPAKAGKAKGKPLRHHSSTVTALGWSDDGSVLASGDRAGQICVWDAGGQLLCVKPLGAEVAVLAWQPKAQVLLAGDTAGVVHRISPAGQPDSPADSAETTNQITDESRRSPSA